MRKSCAILLFAAIFLSCALPVAAQNLRQYENTVSAAEMEKLDPSVRDWEPALALDGGEDGLIFYRAVLEHWGSVLKDDGIIIFEVGEGQAESVRALLTEAGFYNLGCALDTIGVERVVYGRKRKTTSSR